MSKEIFEQFFVLIDKHENAMFADDVLKYIDANFEQLAAPNRLEHNFRSEVVVAEIINAGISPEILYDLRDLIVRRTTETGKDANEYLLYFFGEPPIYDAFRGSLRTLQIYIDVHPWGKDILDLHIHIDDVPIVAIIAEGSIDTIEKVNYVLENSTLGLKGLYTFELKGADVPISAMNSMIHNLPYWLPHMVKWFEQEPGLLSDYALKSVRKTLLRYFRENEITAAWRATRDLLRAEADELSLPVLVTSIVQSQNELLTNTSRWDKVPHIKWEDLSPDEEDDT